MLHAFAPGAGHRRIDERAAGTNRLASAFAGLPSDVGHRQVLTAFKRAAPYLGIAPRLVHAIDTLMAWSRAIDWTDGQRPIVFPSNETLAHKLGVGVRQVQKLLSGASRCGLISHRDSANGNRVGARGADGRLIYAYGIDLSPLAMRYGEFVAAAERGMAADRRLDLLRRRLTAARRRIRSLTQLAIDEAMAGIDTGTDVEIARLAAYRMRGVRDETLLATCTLDLERRADALEAAVHAGFEALDRTAKTSDNTPSDDLPVTVNTTTNQPHIAEASSSGEAKGVRGYDVRIVRPQSTVETDLAQHGIDPEFIADIAPAFIAMTGNRPADWGGWINAAERLIRQGGIRPRVWQETCRLMGQKGAAAAVIATMLKHLRGDVHQPGAYLHGMNVRAVRGILNLGRTYHGLRDHDGTAPLHGLSGPALPPTIGQLAARALKPVRRTAVSW